MKPRLVLTSEQQRGPDGKPLCKTCLAVLPPRRYSYCSDECWHRNTPSIMREMVEQRDKGICAVCGGQCRYRWMSNRKNTDGTPVFTKEAIRKLPSWQADHIIPVAEGGGLCDLSGYRTLCSRCHREATRALRGRLKEKRHGKAG